MLENQQTELKEVWQDGHLKTISAFAILNAVIHRDYSSNAAIGTNRRKAPLYSNIYYEASM